MRPLSLLLFALTASLLSAEPYPLWDGQESVAAYAKKVNLPPTQSLDLGNGVKLDLVLIPAGKFIMGTPEPTPVDEAAFQNKIVTGQALLAVSAVALLVMLTVVLIRAIRQKRWPQVSLARLLLMTIAASGCVLSAMHWHDSIQALEKAKTEYEASQARYSQAESNEKHANSVTLTQPYYMGKFTVTQEQYEALIGENPSLFKGKNYPVIRVSWYDADEFCKKLSKQTTQTFELPKEAEWEYACRAGTTTNYHSGDTESDLERAAWYRKNSKNTIHPVGQKEANAFGLYDMHGNVFQWCQERYGKDYYYLEKDPEIPDRLYSRVLKGCSWEASPKNCRSANRIHLMPEVNYGLAIGFRVVMRVPPKSP